MKIESILEQIDLGKLALPEFQRGYVWNTNQVRGLMASLYRRHPIGGLLIWETNVDHAQTRGGGTPPTGGWVDLVLDGQQRITSLYGIVRGRPPRFFDGNAANFTGLHFNLAEESFEFYAPLKMKDNPIWIDATKLMQTGDLADLLEPIEDRLPEYGLKLTTCLSRLSRVQGIKDIDLHIERVNGPDKTVDVVVEIFNRVNSGGTTLSKGDLALAKVCAAWPEARGELRNRLDKWRGAGFQFKLEWFLRCITTVSTGDAFFSALVKIDTPTFQSGLIRAEHHVDQLLNMIAGRLGLDHGDVFGSPYSLPLLCRYLEERGGQLPEPHERDRLLYWYIHTFLWGRYAGSTESVLSQDLRLLEQPGDPLAHLIGQLRQNRGDLRIQPNDFQTWSKGSRFYPLLYMLTRVHGARDLESGLELHKHLLGHLMRLELHHIFPKAKLYKAGYTKPQVNALANFMFLTQETNLKITDRDPVEYLAHYEAANPGVLASHWIPADPDLWRYENYLDFLAARRALLAEAANGFLDSLIAGNMPETEIADIQPLVTQPVITLDDSTDEDSLLLGCNEWVIATGLPEGEFYYEVQDDHASRPPVVFDLAWPDGLQPGYSEPVAILLNEDESTLVVANRLGFKYFTDIDAFKGYVQRHVLEIGEAAD